MIVIIKNKHTEAKMCRAVKKFYEKHVALGLFKQKKIRDGVHRILKDKKKMFMISYLQG